MLPGKTYTPDDYLQIAWRRKWLIVVPAIATSALVAVWSAQLPNRYQASTSILIVPQSVPTDYVRPAVEQEVDARLQVISQEMQSRTRLEQIIQELDLYARERTTMLMEDVIDLMRRDIRVDVAASRRPRDAASSFSVTYQSSDPHTAMRVADRIAALFVEHNIQTRGLLADSTDEFLQAQLDDARRRLAEQEGRIEAFRRRNAGRLPEQVESNLQMMQAAQAELHALSGANDRDRDRLASIETQVAESVATVNAVATAASAAAALPIAQQLDAAREEFRAIQLRLTPEHPDYLRAQRTIDELQVKAAALVVPADAPAVLASLGPAEHAALARISELRSEADAITHRIDARRLEGQQIQARIADYAARAEAAPAIGSDLTELTRDYGTLNLQYQSLLTRSEEARLAVELERRQVGEQFRILDTARLPERPISPNRSQLNLVGLLAGLGLGLVLVAGLEYRDTTLGSDDDVTASLSLPVLAVIPLMTSAPERRLRARRRAMAAGAASIAGVVGLVALLVAWRLQIVVW